VADELGVCFAYAGSLEYDVVGWGENDYTRVARDLMQSNANGEFLEVTEAMYT
jgi:hypothetical protein